LLRKISPNFSLVCDKVKKGFENSVSLAWTRNGPSVRHPIKLSPMFHFQA
jgi:hypothetical protein